MATPKDIVRLAKKVEWREVKSPQGDIVEPHTIHQMFDYAAANLKRLQPSFLREDGSDFTQIWSDLLGFGQI